MRKWHIAVVATVLLLGACTDAAVEPTQPSETPTPTPTTTSAPLATTLAPLPTTPPATTTTTEPPKVVTVWADETSAQAFEALAADFETRRGVQVAVEQRSFTAIRSDVLAAVEDGTLPDLFVGAHVWTGPLLDAGAIAPLRGLPTATQAEFLPASLDAFRIDGLLYGVPFAAETIALWTNVDLAGPQPPATFDELLDICDDLAIEFTCLAVAGGAGVPEAFYQYPFVAGFGGSVLRYEAGFGYTADRAGIDEPEAIAAIEFVAALDRGDYLPALDYVTAKQRFLNGEVAFWLTGHWEAAEIEEAAAAGGFPTTVVPVPPIAERPSSPFLDAIGVFLASGASTEAKILLTDWIATAEAMIGLDPQPPLFPVHAEPLARMTDPTRIPFATAMASAVPTPNLAAMSDAVWEAWGAALTAIRDERAEPASTLREAAALIRELLGIPEPAADEDG